MSDPEKVFAEIEVKASNLYLRFRASKERIQRVLEIVLNEAREAEAELKETQFQGSDEINRPA